MQLEINGSEVEFDKLRVYAPERSGVYNYGDLKAWVSNVARARNNSGRFANDEVNLYVDENGKIYVDL